MPMTFFLILLRLLTNLFRRAKIPYNHKFRKLIDLQIYLTHLFTVLITCRAFYSFAIFEVISKKS